MYFYLTINLTFMKSNDFYGFAYGGPGGIKIT